MIIFGSMTIPSTRGHGSFNCPRCGMARTYRQVGINRWFTLYFIPVLPMGSVGEYVECSSCGGTYGYEVLSYEPAPQSESRRASGFVHVRYSLSLLLLSLGTPSQRQLAAVCEAFRQLTGEWCTVDEVNRDIHEARLAHAQLSSFVGDHLAACSLEQKQALLVAARGVVSENAYLMPKERQLLAEFGAALALPQATIDEIVHRGGGPSA